MLSRKFSLAALAGTLLLAGPALALTSVYDMTGSSMSMVNAGGLCTAITPCTIPVTGTMTIDDDGIGNVTITGVTLAHNPYEVGAPALRPQRHHRPRCAWACPAVPGAGVTVSGAALFGATQFNQIGTTTCRWALASSRTSPVGVSPLTPYRERRHRDLDVRRARRLHRRGPLYGERASDRDAQSRRHSADPRADDRRCCWRWAWSAWRCGAARCASEIASKDRSSRRARRP